MITPMKDSAVQTLNKSRLRPTWLMVAIALVAGALLGLGVSSYAIAQLPHSLPACTDYIADHGGLCEGPIR